MRSLLLAVRACAPGWRLALGAVALGAVAALGHAPWDWWHLSLLAFAGAFHIFDRSQGAGRSVWLGWLFGLGYFALSLSWIVEPFLVDIARHGWMAPFALVFLSGGLALLWAGAFGFAARFSTPVRRTLGLVVFWTAAEMLRSILFTGFPWALIGHVLIDTPILQLSALGGGHFLTLLALGLAALSLHGRWYFKVSVPLVLFGLFWLAGMGLMRQQTVDYTGKTIRLLQPNAAQHLKWDPEMVPTFYRRLLTLSGESAAKKPDLIVWPETALAYRLNSAEVAIEQIADVAQGIPVVLGANDVVEGVPHNALALIGTDGAITTRYYKHHLVPFGEYLPFGDLLSKIGIRGLAARDGGGFGAGPGPQVIDLPGIGSALPLICYELIFPRNLRGVPRPDLILQITNDAWFGNISGPYQHLAQARLRAVEQGLPLLRSANTGISAVIDPLGRVVDGLELNQTGYLDATVPKPLSATFYARFGDWPIRGALLMLLFALFCVRPGRLND